MKLSLGRGRRERPPTVTGAARSEAIEASVIIPTLNAAEHVEEQLSALSGQRTDVLWEVVVADNGSTDGTRAVLERWAPGFPVPLRIVDGSATRGCAAARNAGAAAAVGELLLFADADDVVDQMWVQRLVGALREHPFVGGEVDLLELNDPQTVAWYSPLTAAAGELPHLLGRPCVPGCNFGLTRAAFAAVGGFDETALYAEDVELSFRMHDRGVPAVLADGAIVHYRLRTRPIDVVRQHWKWAASAVPVNERYGIPLPTCLDVLLVLNRATKQAIREGLLGRRPVRQAVAIGFALGQASVACTRTAFWHPVFRQQQPISPLAVQRDRLARLTGAKDRVRREASGAPGDQAGRPT